MKIVRIFLSFCILTSILPISPALAKWKSVSARSALFSNSTAVVRYYGKNPDMRVLPASTTKVMTALLVLEHLSLDQVVKVNHPINVQPTSINLQAGEQFTVRDLLFALLMKSANDASIVLAEAVSGSESQFVVLMNQRAKVLGCRNTRFANSNGLPTRRGTQYTSAYDMYLIFRNAIQSDFFRRSLKIRYHQITSLGGRKILLKSHNKILLKNWKQKIYGKTGYTRAAQSCFVGFIQKGEQICIISVFGSSRRWDDIKYIVERYGGIDL